MSGRRVRNPENEEAILRLLRSGSTKDDAAIYVGMDPTTLWRWTQADARFRRACEQASATARIRALAVVIDDAFGRPAQHDDRGYVIRAEVRPNVESAKWYLERRDPLNWGRRVTVDIRATVEKYAAENGMDVDEVMAEIERIYQENAGTFRRAN